MAAGASLACLVLVALIAGLTATGQNTSSRNLDASSELAHNSNLFRNMGYDLDWQPGLNNEVRSFLTLTGAGTVRRANQIDNNPEHALNEAGMRPLVSTAEGVALWPNCSTIKISVYASRQLNDLVAAQEATTAAVSQLATLTGLQLETGSSNSRSVIFEDLDLVPTNLANEIQLVWIPEGSAHLAKGVLGETSLHFSESRLELRGATVLLSEKIMSEASDRRHWTGDTAVISVLHELGHAVGLGHSLDPHSIMAPTLADEATLTIADRSALAYAGTRQC